MSSQEFEPIDRDTITPASKWIHDLLSSQLLNVQNVENITLYELLTIFKISCEKWMLDVELPMNKFYDILSLHFKNTYRKLLEQKGLFNDNDCMIFNTGLRDRFGNRIYAYYSPYRTRRTNLKSKSEAAKWKYEGLGRERDLLMFVTKLERDLNIT